jgi:pyrimidine-specific ribonucleoside hydrolase
MKNTSMTLLVGLALVLLGGGCAPAASGAPTPKPSATFREPGLTPYVSRPSDTPEPALATATGRPAPTLKGAGATAAAHPRPVMIDTDMAGDDWMAILYLLQRTDIVVQAISVAGTGEAHCGPGVEHALGLAALAGQGGKIPAACGRETPLAGSHVFPDSWRKGVDSLNGLSLPPGSNPTSEKSALALLGRLLQDSPEPVTLLSTGPLTNLGELLSTNPAVKDKIAAIYIMGGAVHVAGNIGGANTRAEWNIYVDPRAANVVFESGVPVVLVGLDATNHAPATPAFYEKLKAAHLTPEATFVYDLFTRNRSYQGGGFYFWDPSAAAILTEESLASYEQDGLCVVEEEGPNAGQTQIGAGCPNVRVAVSMDGARFEEVFLATLNNP